MSDVYVRGNYLLYSAVEMRMLWEMAITATSLFDYITIEFDEFGLEFQVHDRAMVCQADFMMDKELFEFYEAVKGSIQINSKEFADLVKDMGNPTDTAGLLIEEDKLTICYDAEEYEIPRSKYGRKHFPKPIDPEVSAYYSTEYLMNILKLMDEDIVQISMEDGGPITIKRTSYESKMEVSYTLAAMKTGIECEVL